MILVKQYVAKDTSHEPSQNTFADRKMLSKLIFPGKHISLMQNWRLFLNATLVLFQLELVDTFFLRMISSSIQLFVWLFNFRCF